MRLDKYICDSTELTRKEAKRILKAAEINVNGELCKDASRHIKPEDTVQWLGDTLSPTGTRYIMLNKPVDTICSTKDEEYPSVLGLLDVMKVEKLHIAGRLDADTTGLVLITDDGKWSHRVTSPNSQCFKTYYVWLAEPLNPEAVSQLEQGVMLNGESKPTAPAKVTVVTETEVQIQISEGRYHQVKRMFAAVGNKVEHLNRDAVGDIVLDETLEVGEWRYLTEQEVSSFK